MAFSVYIGNVTKRKNSTYRPTLTTSVDVVLKDGTSDTRPSFLLNSGSPISANYLIWGSRYYFIEDVVYERNNLYTLNCRLDALATYKANVGATTAFVMYDGTANTEITDTRLSMETTKSVNANSQTFSKIGSGACVIVSTVGKDSAASFAMGEGQAKMLLNSIQSWMNNVDVLPIPDMSSITDIAEALGIGVENLVNIARQLLATGNAANCLRNAFMLPVSLANAGGSWSNHIYLGEYDTGIGGAVLSPTAIVTDHISLSIPWPNVSDWRRNAPFTRVYLYLPYVGCVEIPSGEIIGDANISILTYISPASGDTIFKVASGTRTIMQFSVNIAAPYAIGASNVNPMNMASSIIGGVGSTLGALATGSGGAMIAAGSGVISGVWNAAAPMPSSVGGNPGSAAMGVGQAASVFTVFHDTNVAPNSVAGAIGTPAMAVKTLGNLSGYIECRAASVSAPAESAVLDEINGYLNSGFFME